MERVSTATGHREARGTGIENLNPKEVTRTQENKCGCEIYVCVESPGALPWCCPPLSQTAGPGHFHHPEKERRKDKYLRGGHTSTSHVSVPEMKAENITRGAVTEVLLHPGSRRRLRWSVASHGAACDPVWSGAETCPLPPSPLPFCRFLSIGNDDNRLTTCSYWHITGNFKTIFP